jgi:hypothetical protein
MHSKRHLLFSGVAAASLAVGMTVGVIGGAFSLTAAAAATPCKTGIGIGIGATILEGSGPTHSPSQSIARVTDTIEYNVKVSTTSTECKFSNGSVVITTPDGGTHVIATGLALTPGQSKTYTTIGYVVKNTNIGKNNAPAGKIRALGTVVGTSTETGGTVEATTSTTHYDIGVIHPETVLTKMASPASGPIPLKVTYTFTEKNVSTDPTATLRAKDVISTVKVTDTTKGCTPVFKTSSGGTPANTTTKLQVGATWTYTCTATYTTVNKYTDNATGTGNAADGREAGTPKSMGAPADETAQASVTALKAQPKISTTQQPASGTTGVTVLNDKVTLSTLVKPVLGTTAGKITVKLYSPSSPTCTGTVAFTQTITAKTGNGSYTTSGGPTANAAGTWHWTAVYAGDKNNLTATSGCTAEPVTITSPAQPSITTTPQPASGTVNSTTLNDQVTLSGLVNPVLGTSAGKITVKLYPPSSPTCTGTAVFTQTITAKTGNHTYTTTGGPKATVVGTYHWTAFYGGDKNNLTATSGCALEPVTITGVQVQTLTPGFWKNHRAATTKLLPLFLGNYKVTTFTQAHAVLATIACKTTGIGCLAGQLLAAELNNANGSNKCILTTFTKANTLLKAIMYNGPGTGKITPAQTVTAKKLASELSLYNSDNTGICP